MGIVIKVISVKTQLESILYIIHIIIQIKYYNINIFKSNRNGWEVNNKIIKIIKNNLKFTKAHHQNRYKKNSVKKEEENK